MLSPTASAEVAFASLTRTTPFVARIPIVVEPWETAARAFSIWPSFPEEVKVVREKL